VDPVADKSAREGARGAAVARRRCKCREVAVEHRLRGDEAEGGRGIASLDAALVTAEDEQLVLDDRRAERAAKLIAIEAVALRREEVARDEVIVAQELEGVAVHLVRT